MDWSFGEALLTLAAFFFSVLFIWMFIAVFADIFRRRDLSGWSKAGWILLIAVLPLLGILVYVIARPRMTEQDREDLERAQETRRRLSGYSPADEIAKLAKLHDEGKLTDEEYAELKRKATLVI